MTTYATPQALPLPGVGDPMQGAVDANVTAELERSASRLARQERVLGAGAPTADAPAANLPALCVEATVAGLQLAKGGNGQHRPLSCPWGCSLPRGGRTMRSNVLKAHCINEHYSDRSDLWRWRRVFELTSACGGAGLFLRALTKKDFVAAAKEAAAKAARAAAAAAKAASHGATATSSLRALSRLGHTTTLAVENATAVHTPVESAAASAVGFIYQSASVANRPSLPSVAPATPADGGAGEESARLRARRDNNYGGLVASHFSGAGVGSAPLAAVAQVAQADGGAAAAPATPATRSGAAWATPIITDACDLDRVAVLLCMEYPIG